MGIQILRGLFFGSFVLGLVVLLASLAGLPENISSVAVACIPIVVGYGGFRWISGKHSDAIKANTKPSGILRIGGLLLVILGGLLLLRGGFGFLGGVSLLALDGTSQEHLIIVAKLFAIGIVPGLLLVAAGLWLRKANKIENVSGAVNAGTSNTDL